MSEVSKAAHEGGHAPSANGAQNSTRNSIQSGTKNSTRSDAQSGIKSSTHAPVHTAPAVHGGTDALGVARHDFSTNANACGPCPLVLDALQQVNSAVYPDPQYTALNAELSAAVGVYPDRIVLGASASECISRLTAAVTATVAATLAGQPDRQAPARVFVPTQAYGDYARAAQAWGLPLVQAMAQADLIWQCEPASPTGQGLPALPEHVNALRPEQVLVLDAAYAPLRLDGHSSLAPAQREAVWQLFSPNKALGLTGIRAGFLIAPRAALDEGSPAWHLVQRLRALAPSWPLGAHGVALLSAWLRPDVQQWLQQSLAQLRAWRLAQNAMLRELGWALQDSVSPYGVAQPPVAAADWQAMLVFMRARGVKLRDAASLGLPGWLRLAVRAPADQQALREGWLAWQALHAV